MTSVNTIMTADESGSELVEFAKLTADQLVKADLKRTQIRNIFTEARKIEALWDTNQLDARRRLNMLKPKLDYQVDRHRQVKGLRDVLTPAIDEVDGAPDTDERNRRFQRFMDLFEAILAYHRAFGGRN
jgi:CRISPR-associated protein Csm2